MKLYSDEKAINSSIEEDDEEDQEKQNKEVEKIIRESYLKVKTDEIKRKKSRTLKYKNSLNKVIFEFSWKY
jgi:hypothetical protein